MSQNYKITLVNVFWTENGIDTRFFKSVDEQRQYFDILTEGVEAPFVNFQMGDNITTRVTYKDNSARSVEELMRCNYCVVRKFNEEKTQEIERRYFFAYPRSQDSMGQIIVDLSLDDLQTNYVRYKNTIAPCQINKAHINRWVDNGNDTVSFDGNIDSKLFERENIVEVAKRLTRRTKVDVRVGLDSNENVNVWYKNHIWGWVYIFLDQRSYKFYNIKTNTMVDILLNQPSFAPNHSNSNSDGFLKSPLSVLCFPLYKSQYGRLYLRGQHDGQTESCEISIEGFNDFVANNTVQNSSVIKSYVKSMKFSVTPPRDFVGGQGCEIVGDNLYINGNGYPVFGSHVSGYQTSNRSYGGYGLIEYTFLNNSFDLKYNSNKTFSFSKSEILNSLKNPIYNPKLLNSDYFELKITNERGNGFSYDLQKLNANDFTLQYSEAVTPDITRSYLRIKNPSGVYIDETSQNLTGLVDSADMSLMVDNDQLSQMLANNKNFYLQNVLNIGEKALMGGIGGAIAGKGVGAIVSSIANAGMSLANMSLTVDNMRNAPKDLKNANGNAYFNTMYTEPGLYIEEYEILENEKQIINDEMFKNGYVVNLIGKVSDYDNIRHTFNYLSANVETISAPISNEEKERLKQKLQNVRFWNMDTIDYENAKNYERWLNNEQ